MSKCTRLCLNEIHDDIRLYQHWRTFCHVLSSHREVSFEEEGETAPWKILEDAHVLGTKTRRVLAQAATNENNEPRSRLTPSSVSPVDSRGRSSPFRFRPAWRRFDWWYAAWLLASSHSLRGREQEQ